MLASELDQHLRTQYELVCFEDLSDVLSYHSSIFQLLKRLHKPYYGDNERLVFYTALEPNQLQLDHIQRAMAAIDISNFFALIVCPFDIVDKINISNQKFGYDQSLIQSLILPLENTKPFATSRLVPVDSLCALPFVQTEIDTLGKVRPCCKFQYAIGDVNTSSLDQIWSSPELESVRQEMRNGGRPEACSICWHNEEVGTTSYRQLAWHKYGTALDNGWLDDVQIRDLTWSPVSLCNFGCRICKPVNSTNLAVEEIRFAETSEAVEKIKHIISITNNNNIVDRILPSLVKSTGIEHVHILGGEPFLWPKLSGVIDTLIANGVADRITLEINTNASVYPQHNIIKIIENFRAVQILLSVDNIGPRFEIERGGKWNTVLENIEKFATLQSATLKITLAVTVNLQNVLYLDDVAQFAQFLSVPILWWYLEKPEFLSVDRGTEDLKKLVFEKYKDSPDPELKVLACRVANSVGSDGQEFLAWCKKMDARRGQFFSDSHAEIYTAMGG